MESDDSSLAEGEVEVEVEAEDENGQIETVKIALPVDQANRLAELDQDLVKQTTIAQEAGYDADPGVKKAIAIVEGPASDVPDPVADQVQAAADRQGEPIQPKKPGRPPGARSRNIGGWPHMELSPADLAAFS